MKKSRLYQSTAIETVFAAIFNGKKRVLVVAPVGAGKSHIIAELIRQAHEKYARTRILVMAHVAELLVQNFDELKEQYPDADAGFYCHSLGQKRLYNDITFCTIQSVHNKITAFNRCPEIIIVDEVHMLSHNDQTQYRRFISAVEAINPNVVIIGLTGSPYRANHGRLDEGTGALFDEVCYEISLNFMFEEGYLVKPKVPKVENKLKTDGVKTKNGDYIASQLEAAVDIDETTKACVKELIELAGNRRRWFGMTAGVKHCEHVRDALRLAGINAEMVLGETEPAERNRILKWFKEDTDDVRVLVNVATLNIGFNNIYIDLLFPMRPTRSKVLYMQYTGRGLRPVYAQGYDLETKQGRLDAIANSRKPDVMFCDFGDIISSLGALDEIDIRKNGHNPKETEGGGEKLFKTCPACGAECAPAQQWCYSCSYCFIKINKESEKNKQILSTDEPPQIERCLGIVQKFHSKKIDPDNPTQKPATMQVTYSTMSGPYKEWVCFDHVGYARDKAIKWHRDRLPDIPPPASVADALLIKYPCPTTITVKREDKYFRIVSVDFSEQVVAAPSEEMNLADFEEIGV